MSYRKCNCKRTTAPFYFHPVSIFLITSYRICIFFYENHSSLFSYSTIHNVITNSSHMSWMIWNFTVFQILYFMPLSRLYIYKKCLKNSQSFELVAVLVLLLVVMWNKMISSVIMVRMAVLSAFLSQAESLITFNLCHTRRNVKFVSHTNRLV